MAIRIIKVDPATESHWEYAQANQFWDMPTRFRLDYGDTVIFWRGGTPGRILGQARVAGEVAAIDPSTPHAWSAHDRRRGKYKHRVPLADFVELPRIAVTYSEFGLKGQSPVFEVPAATAGYLDACG